MKKLLFLLLLPFMAVAQVSTGQEQEFDYGIKNNSSQQILTPDSLVTRGTDGTYGHTSANLLPLSTATTNALELETDVSAGAVSGFTLTNNGNGTVNISSGIAYLRATNDPYAPIIKYPIAAVTNLALTDNANNYVLVDYNGGSPTLTVTTNGSTINTQTNSLAFLIARVGNNLDYLSLVGQNVDPNAKLRVRFLNQEGIRRASGAVLGFSNRNLTLTSSVLFSGLIRINAVDFNTASPDTFTLAYNNGSTWTRTTGQTQINNTQYNNAGVLTTMPNNNFRTDYVYLLPNNPSKLYVIMGSTTYSSLTLAKAAPRPSILPVELQAIGLEVGRLFIEKNSTTIAEVQSSFSNDFIGAPVPEHNSLTGLQGGTSGEYNHLTNAQVTLVNGSEQTTNKATSFSTVNNTLYPTVQAVKTYADGLVVGLLNDRGSYDASSNLFPSTGGSGTSGAILKGNLWSVSVAGTLGGVSVGVGDWIRALVDSPGQTASNWGVVEGNFGYVPANDANVIHLSGNETFNGTKTGNNGSGKQVALLGTNGSLEASTNSTNTTPAIYAFTSNTQPVIKSIISGAGTGDFFNCLGSDALVKSKIDYLGNITGTSFIKSGGTSSQFLKADGSVDSNTYHTGTLTSGYLPKATGANSLGNSLIYDNGTNVGIGINNPLTKLGIKGSLTFGVAGTDNLFQIGDSSQSSIFGLNQGLFINQTQDESTNGYYTLGVGDTGNHTFNLRFNVNNSDVLTLNRNGNVLIGTTTDDGVNKVQVNGGITASNYTGSATLTGTPTAPTPTTGTGIANKDYVDSVVSAAAEPYLVYTALISQSGTSAPTATVLRNTTGGTVSYVYNSTGNYSANISGASYTLNKTIMKLDLGPVNPFYSFRASRLNSGSATLQTWNDSDTAADSLMSGSVLEIRIYP